MPALRLDPALHALAGPRLGLGGVLAVVLPERRREALDRAVAVPPAKVDDRGHEAVAAAGDGGRGTHLDAVLVTVVVLLHPGMVLVCEALEGAPSCARSAPMAVASRPTRGFGCEHPCPIRRAPAAPSSATRRHVADSPRLAVATPSTRTISVRAHAWRSPL